MVASSLPQMLRGTGGTGTVAWSDAAVARAYAAGEDLPQTREATGFGSQRFGYYTWRNNYQGEVADEATTARASSKAQRKN